MKSKYRVMRHESNRPDVVIIDCNKECDKNELIKITSYLKEISLQFKKTK